MMITSAYGLGFQRLSRDLVNVNAWKTMFDFYIEGLNPMEMMKREPLYSFCFLITINSKA